MEVTHSREAKYFYRNHPDVGCIRFKADGNGFTFETEMSVKEATALVDELIDLIAWVTDEKINWTKEATQ